MTLNIHDIIDQEKDKLNSDTELLKKILPKKADPLEFYNTDFDVEQLGIKDLKDIEHIKGDITWLKIVVIDLLKDTI